MLLGVISQNAVAFTVLICFIILLATDFSYVLLSYWQTTFRMFYYPTDNRLFLCFIILLANEFSHVLLSYWQKTFHMFYYPTGKRLFACFINLLANEFRMFYYPTGKRLFACFIILLANDFSHVLLSHWQTTVRMFYYPTGKRLFVSFSGSLSVRGSSEGAHSYYTTLAYVLAFRLPNFRFIAITLNFLFLQLTMQQFRVFGVYSAAL